MNKTARVVVGAVGRAAWNSLRFVLYVLLLALGRVLLPVATFTIGIGTALFLFCLLFRTDQPVPMWAGAGLAISGTALSVVYEAALRVLAPAGVVIVSEA